MLGWSFLSVSDSLLGCVFFPFCEWTVAYLSFCTDGPCGFVPIQQKHVFLPDHNLANLISLHVITPTPLALFQTSIVYCWLPTTDGEMR